MNRVTADTKTPPVAQPAIPAVEVASAAPSSLGVLDEMEWRKCAEAAMKVAGEAIAKLDALKPMLVGAHARLQLASVCVDIQSMYLLRAYVEQRAPTPHPAVAVPGSLTDALERLVHDVRDLMENSEGVAGLHMNGDLAPWSELKESGRYSSWLGDALEQADAALATTSTAAQPGETS